MAQFNMLNYGRDVVAPAEAIRGSRARNALAQQQIDPNSPRNQLVQEQLSGARQGNALAQQRGDREQYAFGQQQQEDNTKQLYQALTEISQNPSAADYYIPRLKEAGILRGDFDYSSMTMQDIQSKAKEGAAAIGKSMGLSAQDKGFTLSPGQTRYGHQGNKIAAMPEDESSKGGIGKGPSSVQEYNFYQDLTPENKSVFLEIKRAQPNAKFVDTGPTVQAFDPVTAEPIAEIQKGLDPKNQPENVRRIETTKAEVQRKADIDKKRPKASASMKTAVSKIEVMKNKISEARGLVGPLTTGPGAILKHLPATDARRLSGVIETIKAGLAFGELSEMRANSPTGGAVGQLTDRERQALSVVQQALDQAQDDKDIIDALDMLHERLSGMEGRIQSAFDQDFMGKEPQEPQDLSIDELVRKYAQ